MKRGGLLLLVMLATSLAGCTDEATAEGDTALAGAVDTESTVLAEGTGAIAGLLVDDRFRPIHLTDEPKTEFQVPGFILVQETGQQVRTDENGQFTVLNVQPGTYTIRADVEGHEATPQRLTVEVGVFNELSIVARRVVDVGSFILTQQFSGFIPCSINVPTQPLGINCFDTSQESYRPGPLYVNFTQFSEATYLIAEAEATKRDAYKLEVFWQDESSFGADRYAVKYGFDTVYQKLIMVKSADEVYDPEVNPTPWTNEVNLGVINWHYGNDLTPAPNTGEQVIDEADRINVGLAIKTEYMISLFLGEPEVDLEAYQILGGQA